MNPVSAASPAHMVVCTSRAIDNTHFHQGGEKRMAVMRATVIRMKGVDATIEKSLLPATNLCAVTQMIPWLRSAPILMSRAPARRKGIRCNPSCTGTSNSGISISPAARPAAIRGSSG